MIDDGTIFRLDESTFLLTCGSPCLAWLRKSALGFDQLSVIEHTEALAALSLQTYQLCGAQGDGSGSRRFAETL